MNTLTLAAIAWLLFSTWRGYKQGLFKVLAGVLGFFLGYVACFIWGLPLAQKLTGIVPAIWQWPVAAMGLFLGIGLLLQLLARPWVKRYRGNRAMAICGAGINAFMALMMLLAALWSLSLMASMNQHPHINARLNQAGFSSQHVLVQISHKFMASAVGLGLTVIGAPPAQITAAKALVKAPAQGVQQLQRVAGSAQTRTVLHSDSVKMAVRSGDASVLINNPDFIAFARQPGIETILALAPRASSQTQEQAVASTLMTIWQKIDTVKQSPDLQKAMADPEIQAIMQRGDNAALMAHPKMQPVIGVVMGALAAPMEPNALSDMPESLPQYAEPATNAEHDVMYKWLSEDGVVNFSTWDAIPASRREDAELMGL